MQNALPRRANVPVQLHGDVTIPQVGYGVWQVADDAAAGLVEHAIRSGYRHIDTATIYENERGVGEGIRASGVRRSDLFVTTKLWNSDQGFDRALQACQTSLDLLGLDYVDLYLMHWPATRRNGDAYIETWHAMEMLLDCGDARAIGVSNFHEHHIEAICRATGYIPAINQVELHPYFNQAELRAYHATCGIVTQSWSPLGQGGPLLADEVIVDIAAAHGATPAQVVLAWHLALGNVVIPKSATPARIVENISLDGVMLTDDDVARINALDRGIAGRIGPDPDEATF